MEIPVYRIYKHINPSNLKTLCLLLLFELNPSFSDSDELNISSPFPKPFVFIDKGVGHTEPNFTLKKSGLLPN